MNFANIVLALRTALAIIPEVIAVIKAIELPGNGAEKAATVVGIVESAFDVLPAEVNIDRTKVGGYILKVLDIVVGLLNKAGLFQTTAK